MSIQDKIDNHTYKLKQKNFDTQLQFIGKEMKILVIEEEKLNHYGDTSLAITEEQIVDAYIDYPGDELPVTFDTGNQGESHFHLYDVLPIEGYFPFSAGVKTGDIIIHKVSITEENPQLIVLQVVNPIVRAGAKWVTWRKFRLAPYTFNLDEYPEIKTVFDSYLTA